jgi:hypothetical protein
MWSMFETQQLPHDVIPSRKSGFTILNQMNNETTDTPETDGEWNRLACLDHPEFERRLADFARKLERERDRMQARAESNGKLAHSSACEAMEYRSERDEARASLAAAEAWSATLADIGDDFRSANAELRAAIRNLRGVKGEHRTQIACERLFALLPENASVEARQ